MMQKYDVSLIEHPFKSAHKFDALLTVSGHYWSAYEYFWLFAVYAYILERLTDGDLTVDAQVTTHAQAGISLSTETTSAGDLTTNE